MFCSKSVQIRVGGPKMVGFESYTSNLLNLVRFTDLKLLNADAMEDGNFKSTTLAVLAALQADEQNKANALLRRRRRFDRGMPVCTHAMHGEHGGPKHEHDRSRAGQAAEDIEDRSAGAGKHWRFLRFEMHFATPALNRP
jgi:hypothetical protein